MRITVNPNACTFTEASTRTRNGVQSMRVTVSLSVDYYRGVTGRHYSTVQELVFDQRVDTSLTSVFGFAGPWEVTSWVREGEHLSARCRALVPTVEAVNRSQSLDNLMGDATRSLLEAIRNNPEAMDHMDPDGLLEGLRDHHPRPFGVALSATFNHNGLPLVASFDVPRDIMRMELPGGVLTLPISEVLRALLDPETNRGVSIPAQQRTPPRQRRRAVRSRVEG